MAKKINLADKYVRERFVINTSEKYLKMFGAVHSYITGVIIAMLAAMVEMV